MMIFLTFTNAIFFDVVILVFNFFVFALLIYLLLYLGILFSTRNLHTENIPSSCGGQGIIRFLGPRVAGVCELLYKCWELNSGKAIMFLTTNPSLHISKTYFYNYFPCYLPVSIWTQCTLLISVNVNSLNITKKTLHFKFTVFKLWLLTEKCANHHGQLLQLYLTQFFVKFHNSTNHFLVNCFCLDVKSS